MSHESEGELKSEINRLETSLKYWQETWDRTQTLANNLADELLEQSADIHALRKKLTMAVVLIEALAEQQAVSDDWYKDDLEDIRESALPMIHLSPKDSLYFAEMLLNPPEPNEALRKLMSEG